jgi:hypothetical protein
MNKSNRPKYRDSALFYRPIFRSIKISSGADHVVVRIETRSHERIVALPLRCPERQAGNEVPLHGEEHHD